MLEYNLYLNMQILTWIIVWLSPFFIDKAILKKVDLHYRLNPIIFFILFMSFTVLELAIFAQNLHLKLNITNIILFIFINIIIFLFYFTLKKKFLQKENYQIKNFFISKQTEILFQQTMLLIFFTTFSLNYFEFALLFFIIHCGLFIFIRTKEISAIVCSSVLAAIMFKYIYLNIDNYFLVSYSIHSFFYLFLDYLAYEKILNKDIIF